MRALVVWLLLAVLAVSAGVLRERWLTPRLGPQKAHLLGTAFMVVVILAVIWLLVRWVVPELEKGRLLALGVLWTGLTVVFEFGFGHYVAGHPWSRLLHDYDLRAGRVWILVLLALLFGPLLLGSLQAAQDAAPQAVPRPATQAERQPVSQAAWTVEFVKGRHGGLCVNDGEGALCRAEVTVRDDGTWSAVGFPSPAPATGTTKERAATRLAAIVEAGWDSLTARPFTDTCPMAYDGQELYYLVRRLPTGEGAERADADVRELRSCTHDFDHPPARRVLDRLEAEWAALGLPGGELREGRELPGAPESGAGSVPGPPGSGGEPPDILEVRPTVRSEERP